MCTATCFKDPTGQLVFTTNRDEHASRPTSPPKIHRVNGLHILLPQDQIAGGSWVGASETGMLRCLMNGAEGEYHWLGKEAEKSRGQVLLDSFFHTEASTFMEERSFEKALPFTLLFLNTKTNLIEAFKWNGSKKWVETFNPDTPHIWSAYTLYPEKQRNARSDLFKEWVKDRTNLNTADVMNLHRSDKTEGGLLLTDSNAVNTISITQAVLADNKWTMYYREIGSEAVTEVSLEVL